MGRLNDKAVAAAKAGAKQVKISDGDGLALILKPNGTKLWWFRYRYGSKEKTLALGEYPLVSLKDARQRTQDARKLLSNGIDPMAKKKAVQNALKEAGKPIETFEKLLDELCAAKAKRASERHVQDYRRSMELHVLPKFGKRDINGITAVEIIGHAKKVETRGRYLAHRIVQRIGEVMDFAVATGRREQNPVTKMTHQTIAPHCRENNPAISEAELPQFLCDLDKYRGFGITKLMLRFMMHTACRTGEARDLIWDWVDLENRIITIPPSGYKTGRKAINSGRAAQAKSHLIPISDQVVTLLQKAQEMTENKGAQYVFPLYRNYASKASENAISSAIANMGWKGRQSGHGFRRLARTAWGDSGKWSREAMERQLSHSVGDATEAAYDKAERLDERREMLQWWSDRIESFEVAQVVPFRKKA